MICFVCVIADLIYDVLCGKERKERTCCKWSLVTDSLTTFYLNTMLSLLANTGFQCHAPTILGSSVLPKMSNWQESTFIFLFDASDSSSYDLQYYDLVS